MQQAPTKLRVRIKYKDGIEGIQMLDVHYNDLGEALIPWRFAILRANGQSAWVEDNDPRNEYRRVRIYNEI